MNVWLSSARGDPDGGRPRSMSAGERAARRPSSRVIRSVDEMCVRHWALLEVEANESQYFQ